MSDDLLDILSNSNQDIDNQKLIDYLNNKLPSEENHEVEKEMIKSEFIRDAVEGLQEFKSKEELSVFVNRLNTNLSKQLEKKKRKKNKRTLKDQPLILLAIIIILILVIVCFIIISKNMKT